MSGLRQALAEINAIRTQVVRDTQFRGYGPLFIAASGVIALSVAALQRRFSREAADFPAFLSVTLVRSRRVHSGLANQMLYAAVEQYLVCGLACLAFVSEAKAISPGIMGIPCGFGQLGIAGLLMFCTDGSSDDA